MVGIESCRLIHVAGLRLTNQVLYQAIALFTVNFAHLHYNVFQRRCEAISGYFVVLARNCLASTLEYIVMQMANINREKGYCSTAE